MRVLPPQIKDLSSAQRRSQINSSTNPLYACQLEQSCPDAGDFVLNHAGYHGSLNACLRRSDLRSLRYIKEGQSTLKWKVTGEVTLIIRREGFFLMIILHRL